MQPAFWLKLFSGGIKFTHSASELSQSVRLAVQNQAATDTPLADPRHGSAGYIDRMLSGLKKFNGKTLIILSGDDRVAQEFKELKSRHKAWAKVCAKASVQEISVEKANHTFASHAWRIETENITVQWLLHLKD